MPILPTEHPQKLPARATLTTFCDHCHTLVPCEQVRTLHGLKWLCAEVTQAKRAEPVHTLSDEALAAIEIFAEVDDEPIGTEQPEYDPPEEETP